MSDVAQTAQEPQPAAPNLPIYRRPLGWAIGGGGLLILIIVAVIVTVSALTPHTFTVNGAMVLVDDSAGYTQGEACSGLGGYDDIDKGTDVVVKDAAGKTVALGSLKAGKGLDGECAFLFTVNDVPDGLKFYGVEISHRGTVQYTQAQMKKGPTLSLGG